MEARRGSSDIVTAECDYHAKGGGGGDARPRNPHCSLITIRHDIPPPVVFPPINHENLHDRLRIFPSPSDSESDSETTSCASTFSPPSSPGSDFTLAHSTAIKSSRRITLAEVLAAKVSAVLRYLWSYLVKWRGVILNFRTVAFVAALLYFRERRRSKSNVVAVKLGEEKIKQLLDQISQMNQMLLACDPIKTIGAGMNV